MFTPMPIFQTRLWMSCKGKRHRAGRAELALSPAFSPLLYLPWRRLGPGPRLPWWTRIFYKALWRALIWYWKPGKPEKFRASETSRTVMASCPNPNILFSIEISPDSKSFILNVEEQPRIILGCLFNISSTQPITFSQFFCHPWQIYRIVCPRLGLGDNVSGQ